MAPFIGWMFDIAREQSPREDLLDEMLRRSLAAGYNAVGLYLEHRFAFACAPWAAAPGCLTPATAQRLAAAYRPRGLRLIPFLNTLGHMEGFIRSEGGQWLAEGPGEPWGSEQACATNPRVAEFARSMVDEVCAAFDDGWVHIGGDETRQLGQCPACAAVVRERGKAALYGEFYGMLARHVLERGRRPAIWGDMLLQHPEAAAHLPRETLIFDWQYFQRPAESTARFRALGFDVVCCPSVQTYNSGWCFLDATCRNVDEHAADARAAAALGVLVTTWEFQYFSRFDSVAPLVYAAGRRLARGADWQAALAAEGGGAYGEAAQILGNQLPAAAGLLAPGTWRILRDRFILRLNPFLLWREWRDEAVGPAGDEVLRLCAAADALLPTDHPLRAATELHRVAVEWVRLVEHVCAAHVEGRPREAAARLDMAQPLLERLRPGLLAAEAAGGSSADPHRLTRLQESAARVARRLRDLPGDARQRPAFETLLRDGYVAHDQAAWRTRLYSETAVIRKAAE